MIMKSQESLFTLNTVPNSEQAGLLFIFLCGKIKSESCSVVSDSVTSRIYSPWNSPGQNTGVGSRSLLQGIFPTEGSNRGLPSCRWTLYQLSLEST